MGVQDKAQGWWKYWKVQSKPGRQGYAKTYGIDYEETFAPVAKMAIVRSVIAVVAAVKEWYMHQMDVKNAFLHGDLWEEVYVEQPHSYVDTGRLDYVC